MPVLDLELVTSVADVVSEPCRLISCVDPKNIPAAIRILAKSDKVKGKKMKFLFEWAVENRDTDTLSFLVAKYGQNSSSDTLSNIIGKSEVAKSAVKNEDIDMLRYLFETMGHPVDCDKAGFALTDASKMGHLPMIQYLLDRGVDIHFDEDRALDGAVSEHKWSAVKLLVEAGADIKSRYNSALYDVALYGDLETINLLLDKGARATDEQSLIYSLAYTGRWDVVELLFRKGDAPVNGYEKNAVLVAAARDAKWTVVELMLHKKPDFKKQADILFGWAYRHRRPDIARYLFETVGLFYVLSCHEWGQDNFLTDAESALDAVVSFLMSDGGDLNGVMMKVIEDSSMEITEDYTDHQLCLRTVVPFINRAEYEKAHRPNTEIFRLLIEKGAKVNLRDAFIAAVKAHSRNVLEILTRNMQPSDVQDYIAEVIRETGWHISWDTFACRLLRWMESQ